MHTKTHLILVKALDGPEDICFFVSSLIDLAKATFSNLFTHLYFTDPASFKNISTCQ